MISDVLVIGGGPAGATAAFQLAAAGLDVSLVDRCYFPRDKTCGESLSPGALARLRAIGMWEPEQANGSSGVSRAGLRVSGMRVRSPSGTTFDGRYKGGVDGTGLVIRRTDLDLALLTSARARGVRVIEGLEAVRGELSPDGSAVVSARERGHTSLRRLAARRVVVADGRRSFLGRQLGFIETRDSSPGPKRFAVRAYCEGVSGLSDVAEMQVGEGGYCGVAPLSATMANVCYVLFRDRMDMTPEALQSDFRRHLAAFPEMARRAENAHILGPIRVVGPLRLRSRRQVSGPFIACGDTTGFLDPFTGEGIAHAVASGILAAEAVCLSLGGKPESFRAYEAQIRALRRFKGAAARVLYGLVSRPALANSAATVFSRWPGLGDTAVRLFGDQI